MHSSKNSVWINKKADLYPGILHYIANIFDSQNYWESECLVYFICSFDRIITSDWAHNEKKHESELRDKYVFALTFSGYP